MSKEIEITGRQCVNLYNAVAKMKDSNVSASGLVEIDIALNKVKVEAIVVGIEKLQKPTAKMQEYLRKQANLRTKNLTKADDKKPQTIRDPAQYVKESEALEKEYRETISQSDKNAEELEKVLDKKFKIELILVERSAFKFDGAGAAEVMHGLAPMLK